MRSPRTILSAIAVLAKFACAPKDASNATDTSVRQMGAANDPAMVRSAIDSANARFAAAMTKGDAATMSLNYADDASVFLPNTKAAHGRAEIEKLMAGMFSTTSIPAAKFTTADMIVSGDYAIETGAYEMTMKPKTGKAINDVGKYITVWKKQPDGSWKILRDISNSDLPAT